MTASRNCGLVRLCGPVLLTQIKNAPPEQLSLALGARAQAADDPGALSENTVPLLYRTCNAKSLDRNGHGV